MEVWRPVKVGGLYGLLEWVVESKGFVVTRKGNSVNDSYG